jgi:hypothetical protein
MAKRIRSSLDPRGITAPTRFRSSSSGSTSRKGSNPADSKYAHCSACPKKFISEETLAVHVKATHPRRKEKDPKPYQGGLPSLGKRR